MLRLSVLAVALALVPSSQAAAQSSTAARGPGQAPPGTSWCASRAPHPACLSGATAAVDLVVDAVGAGTGFGHLRLLVEPPTAEVYIDGFYAGVAQAFEAPSLRSRLRPGRHRIELRAPGYWSPLFDLDVPRRGTAAWRGALTPVTPDR